MRAQRTGAALAVAAAVLHLLLVVIDGDTALALIDLAVPFAAVGRPIAVVLGLVVLGAAALGAQAVRARRRAGPRRRRALRGRPGRTRSRSPSP